MDCVIVYIESGTIVTGVKRCSTDMPNGGLKNPSKLTNSKVVSCKATPVADKYS